MGVAGYQCQTFELSLGYRHSVKGVTVVHWQPGRCYPVLSRDVEKPEAAVTDLLWEIGRPELAECLLMATSYTVAELT